MLAGAFLRHGAFRLPNRKRIGRRRERFFAMLPADIRAICAG
jgi:hypothetical protein